MNLFVIDKNCIWNVFFMVLFYSSNYILAGKILGIDPYSIHELQREIDEFQELSHFNDFQDKNVHLLTPGMEKMLLNRGSNRLEIFCYAGEPRSIVILLKTVELTVKVPKDNFYYYEGSNSSSVQNQYKRQSWLSFSPWRPHSFRLSIYNYSCIGIETPETFRVYLSVRHVDFWRVLTLGIGIGLFLLAPLLARNLLFHYVTGISVGVFGSLLLIVFLLSKMVPKKSGALTLLIGGWGLVLYLIQYLWTNCVSLLHEYRYVAIGYVTLAALISFAVVYRCGPIQDARSQRLVQWFLQLLALCLIFFSIECREFTLSLVIILLIYYNIPLSWKNKIRTYWLRRFPPKRRFLTEEEYLDEGRQETKQALEKLRKFCHSPDCNAWKTMSRLNSPQRFAEFVEGGFHLTDEEILSYEDATMRRRSNLADEDFITTDEDEDDIQPATRVRN